MTIREWILSGLIAAHLVAITFAAIPRPAAGQLRHVARDDGDPVAAILEGPMTRLAVTLDAAQKRLQAWGRPVGAATRPYVRSGLSQNWSMFSSVLTVQRYVRLDYYVEPPSGMSAVYQQLVLPSQPEGRARLVYRSADKAVRVVLGEYRASLRDEESDLTDSESELSQYARLAPLIRHFTARFCDRSGVPRAHISRLEVWTGRVPIPPPGRARIALDGGSRWEALARYRTLVPQPIASALKSDVPPRDGITWQLLHVEDQP